VSSGVSVAGSPPRNQVARPADRRRAEALAARFGVDAVVYAEAQLEVLVDAPLKERRRWEKITAHLRELCGGCSCNFCAGSFQ
jgi:hypothetical protein